MGLYSAILTTSSPIVSNTISIAFTAPITLNISQCLRLTHMVSLTLHVRFDEMLHRGALGMFLDATGTASCDRFVIQINQLIWRSPR